MTTAVLDTNTIVSGTIVPIGISGQILEAERSGKFVLVTSGPIVAEVMRNLAHPRIRRKYHLSFVQIEKLALYLQNHTGFVDISQEVHGVASHPEDDLILGTAVSGEADYLVTGDRKLQELGAYAAVNIVSPRVFLEVLQGDS